MRIVSATNTSCVDAIRQGRFREDLYYRLNVIELQVPPLAERRDDILPLARHFLEPGFELPADAERALLRHDWPGNVRELRNCIRRACLLAAPSAIRCSDLMLPARGGSAGDASRRCASRTARRSRRPDTHEGVVAKAARELGLSRQSLYRRMEKLGIATGGSADGR